MQNGRLSVVLWKFASREERRYDMEANLPPLEVAAGGDEGLRVSTELWEDPSDAIQRCF
jgi:hypothetical protein